VKEAHSATLSKVDINFTIQKKEHQMALKLVNENLIQPVAVALRSNLSLNNAKVLKLIKAGPVRHLSVKSDSTSESLFLRLASGVVQLETMINQHSVVVDVRVPADYSPLEEDTADKMLLGKWFDTKEGKAFAAGALVSFILKVGVEDTQKTKNAVRVKTKSPVKLQRKTSIKK
jgi:hypothetical protein